MNLENNDRINKNELKKSIRAIANGIATGAVKYTSSNFSAEKNVVKNVVNLHITHDEIRKIEGYDIKIIPTDLSANSYFNELYTENGNFKKIADSKLLDFSLIESEPILVDIRRDESQVIISVQYSNHP